MTDKSTPLPTHTRHWLLSSKPTARPLLTGPNPTFTLATTPLPPLQPGALLLRTLYLSNDPAQRGWISPHVDPKRLYVPPVPLSSAMRARGLAQVLASSDSAYAAGDVVVANVGWAEHVVLPAAQVVRAEVPGAGLPATLLLGALGLNGLTAWFGTREVGGARTADTLVVSGAGGATGSLVVQIAKRVVGCRRVVGIAGGRQKCAWVCGLGADLCLDYKSATFREELDATLQGPDGLADLYFDNVGGDLLSTMLGYMAKDGRIVACGAISRSNVPPEEQEGIKNWSNVISMRLTIRGFVVVDYFPRMAEFKEAFLEAVRHGKIKIEGTEHIVKTAFEDVPKTWLQLFDGENKGKLITAL